MKENNVFISKRMISHIKERRQELSLTAYDLSEKCRHGKYWINNIENGRTKTISQDDAMLIFKVLDDIEHEEMLNDFLKRIETGEATESDLFADANNVDYSRYEEGGDCYEFNAEDHRKALKKQINIAYKKMLSLLEKIDYDNEDSIRSYEAYIRVYTALFTSLGGQEFFKSIFKYPIQLIPNSDVDRIVEIIRTSTFRHYDICYDINNNPYLSLVEDNDDSQLFE